MNAGCPTRALWGIISRQRPYVGTGAFPSNGQIGLSNLVKELWFEHRVAESDSDRFARFCHAEHVDDLKHMAEQMFVMYSKLMEVYKA